MDIMQSLAEAVVIAFLVGAVFGAIVAVHIQSRQPAKERRVEFDGEAQPVKVKANRRDW